MWQAVGTNPSGCRPVRPVDWAPLGDAEFTFVEMIRNTLPDSDRLPEGVDKFQVADAWATGLKRVRGGAGFEHSWRDDSDEILNPSWVTFLSVAFDRTSGRVAAVGRLTHENWAASPAYDLGAITGSNGMSWAMNGHRDGLAYPVWGLYVGSFATGMLAPADFRSNLSSVDIDPATGTIAVFESLGSVGCVAVYDHGSRSRRRLTVVEPITGNERLTFSADGRWLLVPRDDRSILCEVATGRHVDLPIANADWWPAADSMLVTMRRSDDGQWAPYLYNLEQNAWVQKLPDIHVDDTSLSDVYMWAPVVSPDGTRALIRTHAGVDDQYRQAYGAGAHLIHVDLLSGEGSFPVTPLLDRTYPWERDVSDARWNGEPRRTTVHVHPDIEAAMQAPTFESEHLAPDFYSEEAEEFMVKTINRAIELTQAGQSMAHLMPDAIAALAVLRASRDRWDGQQEWLDGLTEVTSRMAMTGELAAVDGDAWTDFAKAFWQLRETPADIPNPISASWVSGDKHWRL
ncbi:hypothetical protein [Microbacterium candidum]|nr:hypothetical protein [Microbacterium sp. ASV49]